MTGDGMTGDSGSEGMPKKRGKGVKERERQRKTGTGMKKPTPENRNGLMLVV
jgi:hypothetical protein